ncbi:SMI1/KNR4 family containing protein [Ceratobasidium sp. AG-Ba]|nr:SMI1/KNR4 family containing protein [Ceratobasidium sp. AG-Ba]
MSQYLDLKLSAEPRRVLYADDDHTAVEIAVAVARDMALHGYMSQSEEILAPIWNFSKSDDCTTFSHDFVRNSISLAGLEMLWKESKYKPKGLMIRWRSLISELKYTDKQLELEQREYFCQIDETVEAVRSSPRAQWVAMQKCLSVLVDPVTGARKLPPRSDEIACKIVLGSMANDAPPLSGPQCIGSKSLALALDLALKYRDWDTIPKIFKIFAFRIANLVSDATRELALAPRTGQIVCNMTTIRDATGLTLRKAEEITDELVGSLKNRFRYGEPRPHSKLSWEQLIAEIEKRESLIQEEEHEVALPFHRPPATPKQIEETEAYLRVRLPQDYKDFLAVSDGLGSFNISQTTPLLSVDEIFWDTSHRDLLVEYRRFETPNEKVASLPRLNRVLQISEVDDDAAASWWFIEPSLVRAAKDHTGELGGANWLGVNYAEWNPIFSNRGSFRLMMERRLSFLIDAENRAT